MSRRILLIEDDPISLEIIRSLLAGRGHIVDVATDGFGAIEKVRTARYDAALIDYHLPEMDGFALGRLLGDERRTDGAPPVLIGLTADRNGLAARRGSDAVFKAILPKPIKPAELFEALDRLCAGSEPPAARDGAPDDADAPSRATAMLWRGHGLPMPPRAAICPPPSQEQRNALALCFEPVAAAEAEIVILLERHGINAAIRISRQGNGAPLPIIGLSPDHADICDALFKVGEPASWREVAALLGGGARSERAIPVETRPVGIRPFDTPAVETRPVETRPVPATPPALARPEPAEVRQLPAAPGLAESQPDLRPMLIDGVATPLSGLRALLEAALRQPAGAPPDLAAALAAVGAAQMAAETLADYLKPASPDAMNESMTAGDFDPAELVGNAVAMIRETAPADAPRLSWRVDPATPARVRADAHRLSQILLTLLDDAAHGRRGGAATLHVGFSESGEPALGFRLVETEATTPAAPEHGVVARLRGLRATTLRRMIALAGGQTAAGESIAGAPCGFTLPAARIASDEAAPARAGRVLLVDDGAVGGEMLTLLLTQAGRHVCRAPDLEAAIVAADGATLDLALVDLAEEPAARQSALEGLVALRRAQRELPILLLCPTLGPREQAALIGLAPVASLAKPFSPDALAEALAALTRAGDAGGQRDGASLAAIDRTAHDALVAALGQASVERLSRQLLDEVERLACRSGLEQEPQRAGRLVELSGCAAMLGMPELAETCRAFDAVTPGARDLAAVVARAGQSLARVRAALAHAPLAA